MDECDIFYELQKITLEYEMVIKPDKPAVAVLRVSWFMGAHHIPSWLHSDGRQAWQGLVTDTVLLHLSVNTLQMVAPRAAIWIPPSNGVSACMDIAYACPTQNFYKRGARCTSGLTFGQP